MIRHGICERFLLELLTGLHKAGDDYRIALYRFQSDVSELTRSYTPQGEASGRGYKAGGMSLKGIKYNVSIGQASISWDFAVWSSVDIRARYALIYNASLPDNNAVAVLDLPVPAGEVELMSYNAPFTVELPAPTILMATRR